MARAPPSRRDLKLRPWSHLRHGTWLRFHQVGELKARLDASHDEREAALFKAQQKEGEVRYALQVTPVPLESDSRPPLEDSGQRPQPAPLVT